MIQIDDIRYKSDEGCFIVRKEDNYVMGEDICLGSSDSIDNYKDEPYTEESKNAFYESIGMPLKQEEKPMKPTRK